MSRDPGPSGPADLAVAWRREAVLLRARAAEVQARILEQCADELEAALAASARTRIGLAEAARLTGFTRGHLRRLVKAGTLPNHGTEREPAFLSTDLPRKPGYGVDVPVSAPGAERPANHPWLAARAALFGDAGGDGHR